MTILERSLRVDPDLVDDKSQEMPLSFSSETPVRRYFYFSDDRYREADEILLHDEDVVDLERLRNVGAVVFNHNPDKIIGPIKQVEIKDRRGIAKIGFDPDEEGQKYFKKVKSGSLKGVSFRYKINQAVEVMPGSTWTERGRSIPGPAMIATRWEAFEITLTPIPADASVGVGRSLKFDDGIVQNTPKKEIQKMNEEQIRKLIQDAISGIKVPTAAEIAGQVRAMITEESKPKVRVEAETMQALLARGAAVSPELKGKVADMIACGKTEIEIERSITDAVIGRSDAADHGGKGGDPKTKPEARVDAMTDDDFFRAISAPIETPIQ